MASAKKAPKSPPPKAPPPKSPNTIAREKAIVEQMEYDKIDRQMEEARKRFDRSRENDTPGYKAGGRIDGCAHRGKTKGSKY